MRPQALAAAIALAGATLLASAIAGPPDTSPAPLPGERAPVRVPPAPPDFDLESIRDIFRFADEPVTGEQSPGLEAEGGLESAATTPAGPLPGFRLVGLVRHAGQLKAALTIDGEVLLLGEGESASGFTVVGVSEELVQVRTPEGEERDLALP